MALLVDVDFMTILVVMVAASICIFFLRGRRRRLMLQRIPGPRRLPVLGNLLEIAGLPNEDLLPLLLKWATEHGPIYYVDALASQRVLLTGPEEIQVILSSHQNLSKDSTYSFIQPWLDTGLLTSPGIKWRSRRRMLNPAFHIKILEDFLQVFNANSMILVAKLREHTADKHVEIDDLVALCALDIICETAMGISVHAQLGEGVDYVLAIKRMCDIFIQRNLSPWLYPDWIYRMTPTCREQNKVVRVLQDFSGKVIKKKRAEFQAKKSNTADAQIDRDKRPTFLDMLFTISEENGSFTDEDIREEVNTFMFAGHDTTAAAISWTLYLLGSHQDIQNKVISELSEIFGSDRRQPTMADLHNMVYLDKVIKESLRLYPSVPAISRETDTEIKIGEYTIPARTNVMTLIYVLHRNPSIYPDPERFDPERFSPEQSEGRHPYAYIPFSAGPRNCIGQKFARLEQKCVLSFIFRAFRVESLDKREDLILLPDVVLKPKKQFKIKFFNIA